MRIAVTVLQMLARVLGLVQLVLGALFWSGNAYALVPVHMLTGTVVVLILWALAGIAAWTRAARTLAAFAVLWGLILPALGVTQSGLLPGDFHWVIRIVHLLTGLVAVGLADRLGSRITRSAPVPPPAAVSPVLAG